MRDRLPHVRPGQRIEAAHINRIADAASRTLSGPGLSIRGQPGQQTIAMRAPLGQAPPAVVVWGVLPEAATAIEPYQAISIGSDAPDWGDVGPGAESRAVWLTEFTEDNLDRIAIALEPIQPGRSGRVALSGCVYVLTDGSASGLYASPTIGSRVFATGETGAAQILYNNAAAQSALIRFPVGGAGGGEGGPSWQFIWNEGPDL
jgi:hypothetical protein